MIRFVQTHFQAGAKTIGCYSYRGNKLRIIGSGCILVGSAHPKHLVFHCLLKIIMFFRKKDILFLLWIKSDIINFEIIFMRLNVIAYSYFISHTDHLHLSADSSLTIRYEISIFRSAAALKIFYINRFFWFFMIFYDRKKRFSV